jgi:hypothetical protein
MAERKSRGALRPAGPDGSVVVDQERADHAGAETIVFCVYRRHVEALCCRAHLRHTAAADPQGPVRCAGDRARIFKRQAIVGGEGLPAAVGAPAHQAAVGCGPDRIC